MKRPRLRFTVRRLMIAVAILAVSTRAVLWVAEMSDRSALYQRRAWAFGGMTVRSGSQIMRQDGSMVGWHDDENDWLRDAWAWKLAEKYWRLSDYPWLPVEPDPPPPEPLAHPRRAVDLPAEMETGCMDRGSRPPAWTFLWTWRRW